ncbi:hypothetical protein HB364_22355 [Pseudoflavitalea sp. X16]|uniref:hypothetical protein n=1 Tax=Paraflavitalea devenefica TaxID=2716334 RepID=UPI0014247704|nr:hypothetical protein [Paraflavitalea devenefica]NII27842.1 hypothetical protein [Paraflavitalea devenefica]
MKPATPLPCLAMLLWMSLLACSKDNNTTEPPPATTEVKLPTLVADSVGSITTSTASFFGRITDKGGGVITDRGIYWGKTANPTQNKLTANLYKSNGEFIVDIKNLEPNTTYYVRGYAINSKGTAYTPDVPFNTTGVPVAEMFTDTAYAAGATTLFVAGKVIDTKGIGLKETGICLSKNNNPTIADTKVAAGSNELSLFLRFNGLEPATDYYIRAYSTNVYGATAYGSPVKVATIQKGNVTYTLAQNANPTAEESAAYARIKTAFDEAVAYYNEFTSNTKTLSVTYNTGVATADANFAGNIRVGPNAGYQRTGTALHEIAHTMGVGQHWYWTSNLIIGGVYQGVQANKLLRFMTRNPAESLKGDNLHFWPYGINGASEDTGQEMLYITNVLVMQGMKKDGLPSN